MGIKLIISGRVQGVGFRHFAKILAEEMEIVGYVRNLPSGAVEILCDGARLHEFVSSVVKGPALADVGDVEQDEEFVSIEEFKIL